MQFRCHVEQQPDGIWRARHTGADVGRVEATAATRQEVLDKLRRELRYRLEFCPCSGELYADTAIELVTTDAV